LYKQSAHFLSALDERYVTSFYCRHFCGMLYGFVKVEWLEKKEEIEIKVNGS
jgi:hypothetical protein